MTLSVIACVLLAVPVLAAEAQGENEGVNLFAGNLGNAVWTLLIFFLVLGVLGKFAWGPILQGLQKREEFIRDSLASAKKDRDEAKQSLEKFEAKLDKAREEASAIVEEGRRDSVEVKRRIEVEARKSADEMIERAKREIGIARDTALKDLYDQSAELAMNVAGTVLRRQLSPEDHQSLVQDALKEMRERASGTN